MSFRFRAANDDVSKFLQADFLNAVIKCARGILVMRMDSLEACPIDTYCSVQPSYDT